ncbi:MAG TPA: NAD(P)H-dependent glycerol-3-phosphate dehydrogenase [Bacteroidales bacterium]|nr:NAD(P)H-dependent glycerol-3-phosphate dehydrogenase [Bacteroidales bacterium]HSA43121.1 NAD(P)H-dependent glycerol-3-phosphate dehydrogenase [Bacteroidales bacterium]
MEKSIAVIGGGSWGTALVKVLSENAASVHWWVRSAETASHIIQYRRNPNYLSYLELPLEKLRISTNIAEVVELADLLIFAVPSPFLKESLEALPAECLGSKIIVSAIKGIIPGEFAIVSKFFHQKYGIPYHHIGVISGPCHSEEVAMERLSFLTIAFDNSDLSGFLTGKLSSRYMKISSTRDILGVEYAAVLKNIMAIANGICVGLGYGDNFQSVLIVNSIREVKRFLDRINRVERDINSPVYVGDLIVTAYSQFSRNRTFGHLIGKGYSPEFARIEMKMVAEGYYAARGIHEINRELQVDMPISRAVYNILYSAADPREEMKQLAARLE